MPQITHTDYYSHILGMSLQVEVTGHFGYPIIMFPTSQGSYTQNADFSFERKHFTLHKQWDFKIIQCSDD